jgi:proteasome lid subunit RPN8/RPN11
MKTQKEKNAVIKKMKTAVKVVPPKIYFTMPKKGVSPKVQKKKISLDNDLTVASGSGSFPDFKYHGGPIVIRPKVFNMFFGNWSGTSNQNRAKRLNQFMTDMMNSSYMNILSQYGCGSSGTLVSSVFISSSDTDLSHSDITTMFQTAINNGTIPEPTDRSSVYMVFLDNNTAVNDSTIGVEMCETTNDNAFGFHYFFKTGAGNNLYYAIIPGLTNKCLTNTCSSDANCSLHLAKTQEQRQTQVASHEFSEMITDPELNAWYDSTSGSENGDICNGRTGTLTVATNTWNIQLMYSKWDDMNSNGSTTCISGSAFPLPPLLGWFQIHPETVFDHTRQEVTVVSRAPGNLDLFVIGFDNAVWSTFWNETIGWNPGGWFQIHPETVFDHTKQKISVVSRVPGNLDLFVIGFDNAVWSTYWNDAGGWAGGWFQIHPETVFDHTSQQLSVVSRAPGNLDLFVIGFDNAVWSTYWNDDGGWAGGWFQIHPETVFDHTKQQVIAVSRAAGNLDLFVIGYDNAVWSTYWNNAGGWAGGWFQIHPETVFDHTSQQLSVVSRAPGNLDLFVIGFDNVVWTTFWNDAAGWNQGGWFQLFPETFFDHTNQEVSAVSRSAGNLDLFVIGFNNAVWSTFWNDKVGWNPGPGN